MSRHNLRTAELVELVAQACEAAYRRGYQQAAARSSRQPFTAAELVEVHDWRHLQPADMATAPPGTAYTTTAAERLRMERPEVLRLLEA